MGVDIVAIVEHNFSIAEVLKFPEVINSWDSIHQYHLEHHNDDTKEIGAQWDAGVFEVNEELIEREWNAWETDGKIEAMPRIDCSFADFKINRNTIKICPSWRHKYGNLYDFSSRSYVLTLMRMIAREIGSNKILYCPDSAVSTSILEEYSNMGWTLKDIEEYGYSEFGKIPGDLTKAVYNYFFIDDFNLDLEDYNNEQFIFNRSNEEYFLMQKFGEHMVIKRK